MIANKEDLQAWLSRDDDDNHSLCKINAATVLPDECCKVNYLCIEFVYYLPLQELWVPLAGYKSNIPLIPDVRRFLVLFCELKLTIYREKQLCNQFNLNWVDFRGTQYLGMGGGGGDAEIMTASNAIQTETSLGKLEEVTKHVTIAHIHDVLGMFVDAYAGLTKFSGLANPQQ